MMKWVIPNRFVRWINPLGNPLAVKRSRIERPCHKTAAVIVMLALTAQAGAIGPGQWTHTTEADFAAGDTDNTVVTNLGDVKLATHTQTVVDLSEQTTIIHDLQITASGEVYLAVGPEAALLRIDAGKAQEVLSLPGEQIFALDLTHDGKLLVAVSSSKSRLSVLEDAKLKTIVELEGVRYVWDMLVDGHQYFLATGIQGKLLHVDTKQPDQPVVKELLDAAQSNLLCLGRDKQGRIYAGSDDDGLVYRVLLKKNADPEVFVLYDAPEPEIGALLVMDDGTVYAGTADASQAKPGRLEEAASTELGRPEKTPATQQKSEPDQPPGVAPKPAPIQSPKDATQTGKKNPASTGKATAEPVAPSQAKPDTQSQRGLGIRRPPTGVGIAHRTVALSDQSIPEQPATEPTTQQRDRLRQIIRQRLDKACRSGTLQFSQQQRATARRLLRAKKKNAQSKNNNKAADGNAIYRIGANGFVTEVFRESVMILKLLSDPLDHNQLLVATGSEGQLFRLDLAAEETTILADLEPQQVPAMAHNPAGGVLLGTANPAALVHLGAGFAGKGTYTSPVLDAQQISLWGKFNLNATIPVGTSVAVETHSGNVQDPDQAAWSSWSGPQVLAHDPQSQPLAPRELTIDSPPARFLQYRLTLTGSENATPIADRTQIAYVVPNLKPVIASVQAHYPNEQNNGSSTTHTDQSSTLSIEWEATDPNNDQLLFSLEYQPAGSTMWLVLAQDLDKNAFEWQTRRMPDGRYLVRVAATDSPDNPLDMAKTTVRRADPVLIDNTPPAFSGLEHRTERQVLWINATVTDDLSPITAVNYNVDGGDLWHPALPDDFIYDSTRESFVIKISDLASGPHVVSVRAVDGRSNTRHEAVLIEIK